LGPNILFSTLFSNTVNLCPSCSERERETKFYTHTKHQIKL
jgi:hypothetical protein